MASASNLCASCSKIQFETLSCPNKNEMIKVRQARKAGKIRGLVTMPFRESFHGDEADTPFVPLGSLDRIRSDAATCGLCRIFASVISRQGCVYEGNKPIPTNDEVRWDATTDVNYHGVLTESMMDGDGHTWDGLFLLRRLSLIATFTNVATGGPPDPYQFASLRNVAQMCNTTDAQSLDMFSDSENKASNSDDRILFGGRLRPMEIDVSLLQKWRHICATQHVNTCSDGDDWVSVEPKQHEHIRLIDVQEKCIKSFFDIWTTDVPYTALSYTWGNVVSGQLLTSNEKKLEEAGSLSKFDLPKTIVDGIELTLLLGLRYLWVDALCIRQDDDIDKKYQIKNMANIYQGAELTIIAAAGQDSDAGLPGLRPGSRSFSPKSVHLPVGSKGQPALSLLETCRSHSTKWGAEFHADHDGVDTSKWNTRAWTFQERLLSRRCLIFISEQVFWVCDGGLFCEESNYEPPDLGYTKSSFDTNLRFESFKSSLSALNSKAIDGLWSQMRSQDRFWFKYCQAVEEFTNRDMKCAGDVYDAFQAVCTAYGRLSADGFIWGHPQSRFDLALLWKSRAARFDLYRRVDLTTLPMTDMQKRVQIPSWSWMGWIGPVWFRIADDVYETTTVDISCFSYNKTEAQFIKISRPCKFDLDTHRGVDLKNKRLGTDEQKSESITWSMISTHLPKISQETLLNTPENHILFFWTTSAFFAVDEPPTLITTKDFLWEKHYFHEEDPRSRVKCRKTGKTVGSMDKMGFTHWKSLDEKVEAWEFIRVGQNQIKLVPDSPVTILALQIRWENGVAYRINLAEIEEAAWNEASPIRRLVALG